MELSQATMPITSPAAFSNVDARTLNAANTSKEEAAQAFESVFASLIVKEMRNTLSDGLFGSENSDVLGGLFDLHMGQAMTEGQGLGIKQFVLAHSELTQPTTEA